MAPKFKTRPGRQNILKEHGPKTHAKALFENLLSVIGGS
jgi:hypothetical protein